VRITELASLLLEGGNIFKSADGAVLTQRINKSDIKPTIQWLEQVTGLPLLDNTLGSVGKKESSGDLDIAIDQNVVSKDELVLKLGLWAKSQKLDPKDWIKKSGISVHFKAPINGDSNQGFTQVDFMFGDDINHMKFGLYSAGDKSKFSGADRNLLMSSIAKSMPGDYKYSWQKGLIERSTGNTITKNPDLIAQILLGGKNYNGSNLDSVESIMSALRSNQDRLKLLSDLANSLLSADNKKPADIRADADEADRIHKLMSAEPINEAKTDDHRDFEVRMVSADKKTLAVAIKAASRSLAQIAALNYVNNDKGHNKYGPWEVTDVVGPYPRYTKNQ
jgi:hypothetical protein